jgi:hypothetical protein
MADFAFLPCRRGTRPLQAYGPNTSLRGSGHAAADIALRLEPWHLCGCISLYFPRHSHLFYIAGWPYLHYTNIKGTPKALLLPQRMIFRLMGQYVGR